MLEVLHYAGIQHALQRYGIQGPKSKSPVISPV